MAKRAESPQPVPELLQTIGVAVLAGILGKAPATILSDRRRAPHRLPPECTPRGCRRPRWLVQVVRAWLDTAQEAGGQPRPPKKQKRASSVPADAAATAQHAAEVAAELDASARVQGARTPPPGEPP